MISEGFNPDWPILMGETQKGDKHSYKRLLDEIGPYLYNYIRKRVKNLDDVDDLYQTVLMKVHRARATYDLTVPFEPWLFAIARNSIADFFKKEKKSLITESLYNDEGDYSNEPSVEYGVEKMIFNRPGIADVNAHQKAQINKTNNTTREIPKSQFETRERISFL